MPGAFADEEVTHTEGDVNPARDLQIIHDELRLKDEQYVRKQLEPMERGATRGGGGGDRKMKDEYVSLLLLLL